MISAAAFCPHPPGLVPDIVGCADPVFDDVRDLCRSAVHQLAASGGRLVLVCDAGSPGTFRASTRGSFAGFGVELEVALTDGAETRPATLPFALAVGAWLVRDVLGPQPDAVYCTAASDVAALAREHDVSLLVLADGTVYPTERPPEPQDESAAYDASVTAALTSGDPDALARLDLRRGELAGASGARLWPELGVVMYGHGYRAELLYAGAPYGVGYAVATWACDD